MPQYTKTRPVVDPRTIIEQLLAQHRYLDAIMRASGRPELDDLFIKASLGRAREQCGLGRFDQAAMVLQRALQCVPATPENHREFALALATCGQTAQALAIWPEGEDPIALQSMAVDAALVAGKAGRAALPADLQVGFDAVVTAFAHFEAGRDEDATTALATIGMRSPYSDWKLLLRGLIAWQAGDNARALDNWQRLGERTPAKLVAPLRAAIDDSFRLHQSPETQRSLRNRASKLSGVGGSMNLNDWPKLFAKGHPRDVIRQIQEVAPRVKAERPELMPKLALAVGAFLAHQGEPTEVDRVQRMLPLHPDDPTCDRLKATIAEDKRQHEAAINYWKAYDRVLIERPEIFGVETPRARAHLYCHLANQEMAADIVQSPNPFLPPKKKASAKPHDPVASFRKALELAPDLLLALDGVLCCTNPKQDPKAYDEAIAQLLARHPDHRDTLDLACGRHQHAGRFIEALVYMRRISDLDPLNPGWRRGLNHAQRAAARAHLKAGRDAEAVALLQQSAAGEAEVAPAARAMLAAIAFADGRTEEAEAHLVHAGATPAEVAARMVVECTWSSLGAKVKSRFDPILKAALAGPAEITTSLGLAAVHRDLALDRITYHGQKTHATKVAAKLKTATRRATEMQQVTACRYARLAQWWPTLKAIALHGGDFFPNNPHFPYEYGHYHLNGSRKDPFEARRCFTAAKNILASQPVHLRTPGLDSEIDRAIEHLGPAMPDLGFNPMAELEELFGQFGRDEF